ncbi:hypothetical protein QRD89_06315 [Halobacillus sp. ACCC02827]|uniref:hypothetical protein n=1 Tax=Bacillaceae TaxID=186817 RepID=UPI0002A512F5|nr:MULTISPECIES: hypothetical protein [Bacillaceae]ELK46501.1 hypothetical protein D479_10221 [Halobacillus sp. BAB-2008]QHT46144.1 hypothetical protein M662_06440 [Bacillus sp. SB49]WJE16958.1 hypothetical protein QRD89_06315 [Halobacillus sp. ACCC02827]
MNKQLKILTAMLILVASMVMVHHVHSPSMQVDIQKNVVLDNGESSGDLSLNKDAIAVTSITILAATLLLVYTAAYQSQTRRRVFLTPIFYQSNYVSETPLTH